MAIERSLHAQWKRLSVSSTKVRGQVDDHDQVDDLAQVGHHAQTHAPPQALELMWRDEDVKKTQGIRMHSKTTKNEK